MDVVLIKHGGTFRRGYIRDFGGGGCHHRSLQLFVPLTAKVLPSTYGMTSVAALAALLVAAARVGGATTAAQLAAAVAVLGPAETVGAVTAAVTAIATEHETLAHSLHLLKPSTTGRVPMDNIATV